jgi:hypothetical protein
LKRFDGWEPRQTIRYEHDDGGRLIRSVVRSEPEWDAGQQAWMLALARYRTEMCDGCGGHLPETTDPGSDGRYHVTGPFLCYRCEAIGIARQAFVDARTDKKTGKVSVVAPNRWAARLRRR